MNNIIWEVSKNIGSEENEYKAIKTNDAIKVYRNNDFLYEYQYELIEQEEVFHIYSSNNELKIFKNFKQILHEFNLKKIVNNKYLLLKNNLSEKYSLYSFSLRNLFDREFDDWSCLTFQES